tara:strand:- start:171 stop:743 length:573 start_codon:yes stop_codon:yes gene_type:complete
VLKERIQEIFDFTKSESPYSKANKGWINKYIFLDLSPSINTLKQKNEDAKIILFWSPIKSLLSNIFFILIISSILVFTSLSFVRGKFNLDIFNTFSISDNIKIKNNNDLNTFNLETNNLVVLDDNDYEDSQGLDINELDKENNINSLNDIQNNLEDQKIANSTEKQEIRIKEEESNKDIKNLRNNKSNFI